MLFTATKILGLLAIAGVFSTPLVPRDPPEGGSTNIDRTGTNDPPKRWVRTGWRLLGYTERNCRGLNPVQYWTDGTIGCTQFGTTVGIKSVSFTSYDSLPDVTFSNEQRPVSKYLLFLSDATRNGGCDYKNVKWEDYTPWYTDTTKCSNMKSAHSFVSFKIELLKHSGGGCCSGDGKKNLFTI